MKLIRVLVADDHTILREGLVALLNGSGDCRVVAQAADGMSAVELALQHEPDVIVLDISMPRLNGIEVIRRLSKELEHSRILVLTMHAEEEYVLHVVRAGASGFLLKDSASEELIDAVRTLASGRGYFGSHASRVLAQQVKQPNSRMEDPYRDLTDREREVFHLIVEGMTTKEIARHLSISTKTAENHRFRAMDKLGARNSAELIRYAVKHGLLD
ncbi:response regulator transcription factor [Dokdonella immobilis]|uniref:Two component transcriptional regulator, LuxR family n=1 Tax=Dokdonella immobilis TaxID=578942 RepID=A0A1I4YU60_9GAMM|nr:response regulator transcription factor [Dokdonella immobilis]SFN41497.1 two component transcriptional regulator, LuxR family [Dokdonella immobilis]